MRQVLSDSRKASAMSEFPPLPPAFGPPVTSGLDGLSSQHAICRSSLRSKLLLLLPWKSRGADTCRAKVTQATTQLFEWGALGCVVPIRSWSESEMCHYLSQHFDATRGSCLARSSLSDVDESSQSQLRHVAAEFCSLFQLVRKLQIQLTVVPC